MSIDAGFDQPQRAMPYDLLRSYFAKRGNTAGLPESYNSLAKQITGTKEQRVIELAPTIPIRLETVRTPWGFLRFMAGPEPIPPRPKYLRPEESWPKEGDYQSQDHLFVRHSSDRVVFSVSDGVSKAFMGEFAAQYLGRGLVNRLWLSDIDTSQPDTVQNNLLSYLHDPVVCTEANRLANQMDFSNYDRLYGVGSGKTQQDRRTKFGSHTVFATGRIDFDPQFSYHGRITLAWAGNCRIKARCGDTWQDLTAMTLNDNNRWTTKEGLKGQLSFWQGRVEDIDELVIYTDGLAGLDPLFDKEPSWLRDDKVLQETVTEMSRLSSDDHTLLNVGLRRFS